MNCAKLLTVRVNTCVSFVVLLLVVAVAGYAILRTAGGEGDAGRFFLLSAGAPGTEGALSSFSPEAQQMLARLASRQRLAQEELTSEESDQLSSMLADETRPPSERLTLLFWRLLGRGEVPEPLVLEVLDAGDATARRQPEWDFIRTRICILYAHPLAGGRSLETFIPRALAYAHSASEAAPDTGVFRLYELGLRWVAAYRCGGGTDADAVGSAFPPLSLDELSSLIESAIRAKDWRQLLPPPWLSPFDSFAGLPELLQREGESDYPWEKMNPYSLLIAQQFASPAVAVAAQGEPRHLVALLRLQLAQMRLDPPSTYTFTPGLEGASLLLREVERSLPPDTWNRLKPFADDFRRLRDELSDTGAVVEAHPELLRGGGAKDPRLLFQRIYDYYRDPVSVAVSRIIEVLEVEPAGQPPAPAG